MNQHHAIRLGLVALLLAACKHSDSPTGPSITKPTTKFALLTAKSAGVIGGPSADSTLVDSGKVTPFSFQNQDGYGPVAVLLDGASTTASGNVVMNGRHVLAAGATPIVQSSHADSSVAATARAVVTSANPAGAMNTLVTSLDSMLKGLSPDAAAAAIQRVRAARNGVSVPEDQLRQIDQQLVGKVFTATVAGNTPSSSALYNTTTAAATYTVPLTLFFSNGIDVDPSEFAEDFSLFAGGQLLGDLSAIPHDPSLPMSVHAVYNQTHGLVTSVTLGCIVAAWQASFLQALDWVAQYQKFSSCGGDLGASAQDIANLLSGGDASPDATRLAVLLSAELMQGHAVLVVGHSRGNLVAQQAIGLLATTPPAGIDASKCLGFVSVASPLWQPNSLPSGLLSGTIASGTYVPDILIQAVPGTAKATATATDRTRAWDLAYLGLGVATSGTISGIVRVAGGFDIHHFSSYASATATRSIIQSAIQSVAGTLQNGCLLRTPAMLKLSSSDNVSAQAGGSLAAPVVFTVSDANGQPVPNRGVHFAVQGGLATPADATTGADGSVSVNVTTTSSIGPATLSATVSGTTIAPAILHVTVTPPPDVPRISLSTTTVAFSATVGGGNPGAQTINVSNTGTGTLSGLTLSTSYQAGQPSGWLSASLGSTTAPTSIQLTAATGSLSVGTYTATVSVRSTVTGVAGSPQAVTVTFTVSPQAAPRIALSSPSISFSGSVGGSNPGAQSVTITNGGGGSLSGLSSTIGYTAGQATGWLSASLSSTTAPATLTVTPAIGSLAAGAYSASVTLSAPGAGNSPQILAVTLNVAAAPVSAPTISLSAPSLSFTTRAGTACTPAPVGPPLISISNGGSGTLSSLSISTTYPSGQPSNWLDATLSTTTAPATINAQLACSAYALSPGTYSATMSVSSGASGVTNSPQAIALTLTVNPALATPTIAVSPTSVSFTATAGGSNPAAQTAQVTNSGSGTLNGLSVATTFGSGQPSGWLSASLNSSTAPATLNLSPSISSLASGTYNATISISSTASGVTNSPQTVPITLTVAAPAGTPTISIQPGGIILPGVDPWGFSGTAGVAGNVAKLSNQILNSGTGSLTGLSTSVSYTAGQPTGWVNVENLSSTTAPAVFNLHLIWPGTFAAGTYTATVSVASTAPGVTNSPQRFVVTLVIR